MCQKNLKIVFLNKCILNILNINIKEIEPSEINRSQPSAKMKKGRNMRFIYMLSKFGYAVPKYDTQIQDFGMSDIIRYLLNIGQQFIGKNKILWPVIKIIKKEI